MHYQIEYHNKLWRDWLAFDQVFYQTEQQAQAVIDSYKENIPDIKTRVIQTNILNEKPRRTRTKSTSGVRVERL